MLRQHENCGKNQVKIFCCKTLETLSKSHEIQIESKTKQHERKLKNFKVKFIFINKSTLIHYYLSGCRNWHNNIVQLLLLIYHKSYYSLVLPIRVDDYIILQLFCFMDTKLFIKYFNEIVLNIKGNVRENSNKCCKSLTFDMILFLILSVKPFHSAHSYKRNFSFLIL